MLMLTKDSASVNRCLWLVVDPRLKQTKLNVMSSTKKWKNRAESRQKHVKLRERCRLRIRKNSMQKCTSKTKWPREGSM